MTYRIEVSKNKSNQLIDDYVKEKATIYHLSEWLVLINNVFFHDGYYLYAVSAKGDICGVLPLTHIKSHMFGNYLVSMPYFNYGGIVADNKDIESSLLNRAIDLAKELKVRHIELREKANRPDMAGVRNDKVNMILELPDNIIGLEKALGSKLRSQIKRSRREGFETCAGGMDLLDDFYRVFSENMRDLGTPVYSKNFFKAILKNFGNCTRIIVLKLSGSPVSAAFLIGDSKQLEIPWASTIKKYNKLSPNMLLYWNVLEYAVNNAYNRFDFGRSTIDSGTYKFKQQWGAKPVQLYWNYWLADDVEMPKLNPDNPKYRMAINLWKKLPLSVANSIGPLIVKNLP